jgi:hypothetical protein
MPNSTVAWPASRRVASTRRHAGFAPVRLSPLAEPNVERTAYFQPPRRLE